MKISVLDQSPISKGSTAEEALNNTIKLARFVEEWGYERFWAAEHHDLFGLASPNPNVMLGIIGAYTNTIRLGAGAVLLPYYKPFRVAETYNLLATLYPERIDLGLGRAPGGSAEVSLALSDNYLKQVREYETSIDELMGFLHQTYPADHPYGKIKASPIPKEAPAVWLLGTSEKSAVLAAEKGTNYAFADFMTDFNGPEIVQKFKKESSKNNAQAIVAVNACCAATEKEAEEIALSSIIWKLQQDKQEDARIPSKQEAAAYEFSEEEAERVEKMKDKMIIGNPEQVSSKLKKLQEEYAADELMIVTITHDIEDKLTSYRLIREALDVC